VNEKEENKASSKKDKQITGLSGEYFVAAELLKRDFQVSMTLGNAKSIDLIAISPETNIPYKIQVKTLRKKPNCFTLSIDKIVCDDFYFFVYLNSESETPEYHIIQGKELLSDLPHFYGASIGRGDKRETVNHGPIQPHKNRWDKLK